MRQITDNGILVYFTQDSYDNLIHKFPGAETIEQNYSASWHDMFILSVLDGKKNGTYVEIGGSDPIRINNTYLLETEFDWTGVSFEIEQSWVDMYRSARKNPIVKADAITCDMSAILNEYDMPTHIDYLQVDIEPPSNTLAALKNVPFDEYTFSIIHFEHDFYANNHTHKRIAKEAYEILTERGYKLAVENVGLYEDWYYNPDTVDPEIISKFIKERHDYDMNKFCWGHETVTDCPHDMRDYE
tara:strand:+ start:244 stop:972 length:729 start_codon:yes stop_codon:yes gene_type:complete